MFKEQHLGPPAHDPSLDDGDGMSQVEMTSVPRLIDAFRQIDDELFDVILLDLNLMDMDGVASVAALSAEAPGTPIIVYSGMESEKLRDEALMCGASDYLIKGRENSRSLQLAIHSALSHRAAEITSYGR